MKKICGVYSIVNVINGKIYVGSSNDIFTRFRGHKNNLKKGKHENEHLQYSYNKYGKDSFTYNILEIVNDIENLRKNEIKWIETLNTLNKEYGYNMVLPNGENEGVGQHTEETKEKLRRSRYKQIHGDIDEEVYTNWKNNKKQVIHREPQCKEVLVFNKTTGELYGEYSSPKEVSEILNLNYKRILDVLNKQPSQGKIRRTYKGWIFVYKRNFNEQKEYKEVKNKTCSRKIEIYDTNNELVGIYNSIVEAGEFLGIKVQKIYENLGGINRYIEKKYTAKYI